MAERISDSLFQLQLLKRIFWLLYTSKGESEMTIKGHSIAQILAMLLQAVNLFAGVVREKYQTIVAFAMGVIQLAMGLANHYYTPAGTKIATAILLLLLCGSGMQAQDKTPMFSVSEQAVGVRLGGQTVVGSDSIGSFTLLSDSKVGLIQLQSDNLLVPAINLQGYLG